VSTSDVTKEGIKGAQPGRELSFPAGLLDRLVQQPLHREHFRAGVREQAFELPVLSRGRYRWRVVVQEIAGCDLKVIVGGRRRIHDHTPQWRDVGNHIRRRRYGGLLERHPVRQAIHAWPMFAGSA